MMFREVSAGDEELRQSHDRDEVGCKGHMTERDP